MCFIHRSSDDNLDSTLKECQPTDKGLNASSRFLPQPSLAKGAVISLLAPVKTAHGTYCSGGLMQSTQGYQGRCESFMFRV